ncbi:MAG: family N-acetyltransferase [Clostridia bacterium]|jgi:lipid II:glycine glycyltransferase (peptidoglycan interpeptide bridge formation enzyme)|nr:family N-acetyltransferase [Clostridia bacterium]
MVSVMTDKEKYRRYCSLEASIPIFSKDWWLDAVCGEDNWNVALIKNNGEIQASFPYYVKRKFGFKAITMPQLTQTAGIRIKYLKGQKQESRLAYEKEIINELVDKLPKVPMFRQNFHYSFTNWQPLCWKGFNQTTCYTYIIDDLSNLEIVFEGFSKTAKKNIRKAEKIVEVSSNNSIEEFFSINKKVYERQGISYPHSLDFLKRMDNACMQNNSRKIFYAKDDKGKIYSAIYVIWDAESAYLLMSGSEPDLRVYNCKTLLVWEAIKYAATVTKRFDFEGSMIERVAEYNRQFGAVPKPYCYIFKENPIISKSLNLYNILTHKH